MPREANPESPESPSLDPCELERRLGHDFERRELLERALTHRSWAYENGSAVHYERLEFLGDAVLGLVTAEWLFGITAAPEGELSKLKGFLVSAPVLAEFARQLELGAFLRLGVGEERSGGRDKESLLADVFEAVLGALFLDAGMEPARSVVLPLLERGLETYDSSADFTDAKTSLQERLQAQGLDLPVYRLVLERGPEHSKTFHVECWADDRLLGSGEGSSKKRAEQAAAAAALKAL